MARACVPHMVAQRSGQVVNISTSQVTMVRTGYCPYGPSKAALEAMSVVWAKDLKDSGVSVNVLLPGGATDTRLLPGSGSDRRGADGNLLAPDIMREPIVWLMERAGSHITGQRFTARLWPKGATDEHALAQARSPAHELPAIM
jgi:3-oxoacyl-[acyl-carrier protein] reductase